MSIYTPFDGTSSLRGTAATITVDSVAHLWSKVVGEVIDTDRLE